MILFAIIIIIIIIIGIGIGTYSRRLLRVTQGHSPQAACLGGLQQQTWKKPLGTPKDPDPSP